MRSVYAIQLITFIIPEEQLGVSGKVAHTKVITSRNEHIEEHYHGQGQRTKRNQEAQASKVGGIMTLGQSRVQFLASDEAEDIRQSLLAIARDPAFNTASIYTTATQSESSVFVEKHMNYICNNPAIAAMDYVANLRLRTRIRK